MLSFSLFSLFLVTSFANIMTPGIGFIMLIGLSLQRGWQATVWAAIGLALGIVILQVIGLSGMGLLIAKNPTLYAAVKIVGALVLFYLAWHSWEKAGHGAVEVREHADKSHDTFFIKSVLISLTNPQPLVFTISVFPQFIAMDLPYVPQVVIMIGVYAVMVVSCGMLYAILAGRARRFFEGEKGAALVSRTSAVIFFLIGLIVLALAAKPFF
ncbi:MAG TPA: hypothetical protein DD376_00670 [Sutterella sp.]|nr:hypothetical protein [Sutterella sp.]